MSFIIGFLFWYFIIYLIINVFTKVVKRAKKQYDRTTTPRYSKKLIREAQRYIKVENRIKELDKNIDQYFVDRRN